MAPVKKKKKLSSANHRPISATDANQQTKPLGSFVTFGKRRSVRVAMKTKSRRWVCNDIWMDTLPFFGRPQLGLKMALLSPRFNALVDKHFDGQSELTIWRPIAIHKIRTTAKLYVEKSSKTVPFPLPDHPMHNKIRFNYLLIDYFDFSVVEFLRSNEQIFDKWGTNLAFYIEANKVQQIWDVFAREIWPILAQNIRHLSFSDTHDLDNLRRHTSPTVLTDLNIMSIHFDDLLPSAIAKDGPNATAGQALAKWLQIPTKNVQPKRLICCGDTSKTIELINNFKAAFLRATISSASYIIRFELFDESTPIESFELMNERTNEMLTLEKEKKDDESMDEDDDDDDSKYINLVLKRWQIGKTIQWKDKKLNKIAFELYGNSIGPLFPPKAGQTNAKSRLKMSAGPSGQRKKK